MGLFISVEGPNGVGKTTFIKLLCNAILNKSRTVYQTREPSETPFGTYVKINEDNLTGKTYAHLIATDRCYHIEKQILPNIDKFDIVLSDRYIESSLVLQYFDGVDLDYIWNLNHSFRVPDISIILIANAELIEQRLAERSILTRFEKAITRSEEIDLYIKAHKFLLSKGFNSILLENNCAKEAESAVEHILKMISELEV